MKPHCKPFDDLQRFFNTKFLLYYDRVLFTGNHIMEHIFDKDYNLNAWEKLTSSFLSKNEVYSNPMYVHNSTT